MPKRDWKQCSNKKPKSILVLRLRYLGDIVRMSTPIRNLRLAYPEARIGFVCEENYADVISHNTDIDELILLPRRKLGESRFAILRRYIRFLMRLRNGGWVVAYDFSVSARSRYIWEFAAIPEVRMDKANVMPRMKWAHKHNIVATGNHHLDHVTTRYLRLLEASGVACPFRGLVWEVSDAARASIKAYLPESVARGRKLVLLHPGSRSPHRCYPSDRFSAVIEKVSAQTEVNWLLIGGPSEQASLEAIAKGCGDNVKAITESLSVEALAALISEADLFVGHDSGPMHIAAAVGAPIVALYGSQEVKTWAPVEVPIRLLRAPQPCGALCVSPEFCDPSDSYRNHCVRRIEVADVVAGVCELLTATECATSAES